MTNELTSARTLGLKVGEWVAIRSADEVLRTLDANARFEELPFMPQMLQYCGKRFRVRKRAHKLCDTAFGTGGRSLNDAVFLDDVRCSGEAYGGCELRCAIVWKEVWLRRADPLEPEQPNIVPEGAEALIQAGTRRNVAGATLSEALYVCQGTQLPAATKPLPWWKPAQYVEDYRSGNTPLKQIASRLAFLLYAELVAAGVGIGSALRWIYNVFQKMRGADPFPVHPGHLPADGPTPTVTLGLKEGELVRVKSSAEIHATLDEMMLNRGMSFHPEMVPFCGKTFRVSQRVERLINEKTGQLKVLKNSCLVLEGADCLGTCTRPLNCPRACPPYWREIWLERVKEPTAAASDNETAPLSAA